MKKLLALFLALSLLICSVPFVSALDEQTPAPTEPIDEYQNVSMAHVYLSIASDGTATIDIECYGYSGTSHISSTTYLERRNGSFWTRVKIDGAYQVTAEANASFLVDTYDTTVDHGSYRATAVFTVTRGGVDETVTLHSLNWTY